MPYVSVALDRCPNPLSLYYEIHGSGPHKLLFVNGLGSITAQWDHQVEYYKKLEDYAVCVFDNRGSGRSGCPDVYYS